MIDNDYGLVPDDFAAPLMTAEECAEDWAAELKELERRVRVLHAANPKCAVCKQPIDKPETARHNRLTDGTEFIVHNVTECEVGAIEIMIGRYLTKRERRFVA